MSRETLKDFLNSIGESSDSISFTYDSNVAKPETGVDLGKDAATGKSLLDLDNENVGLLGDYLSFLVENSSNIFKIDSGNERATASKRGESLVLPEEQGASQVFVPQGTELSQNLNNYSNSGKFDAGENSLKDMIDKTGDENHNHFAFRDIQGKDRSITNKTAVDPEGDDNKIVQSVNDILSTHNRFANVISGKTFADRDKSTANVDSDKSLKYAKDFGKSDIDQFTVSLDQLKSIGKSLLLKSSGFDSALNPNDSLNPADAADEISGGLINSNFNNSGFNKKPRDIIRSKNSFGAPTDSSGESIRSNVGAHERTDTDAKNAATFGSTYNTEFSFTRTNPKIHKLQAAIACKVLIDVSKDFMTVIADIVKRNDLKVIQETNSIKKENVDRSSGPFIKGVYDKLASFDLDLLKKLTFVKTTFPYPDCFEKGIEVFFGSDLDDIEKISESDILSDSPGYWLNVATGILKTFDQVDNEISRIDEIQGNIKSKINTIVRILQSNSVVKFANAAAIVGDAYLKNNNGVKNRNKFDPTKRPFSVDNIPTTPGTRIAKSKDENGKLAWRQSSVPNAYLLPRNIIRAGIKLNNITRGAWPARGMLGSELIEDTYLDRKHDGSFNRIPEDIIKNLEDRLEAEYVPFYIQDLRTNEVISFHAFLTQLSDTISPSFSDTPGYGRLDPVQTYNGTRRSLQVGFVLYATSREDYDQMWYKINKLTTLLYPQWTQGTKVSALGVGDSFVQPFSQVLGASPLVRLRVGDVIKSNYSKFNLARLFGIGDPDINPITEDFPAPGFRAGGENILNLVQNIALEVFYGFFGSPLQYIPQKSGLSSVNGALGKFLNVGLKLLREYLSDALDLKNGFANPYGVNLLVNKLKKPIFNEDPNGYSTGDIVKIKPNVVKGYKCDNDGEIYYFDQFVNGRIINRKFEHDKVFYKIIIIDGTSGINLFNKKLFVSHDQILPDYRDIFINFGDTPIGSLFQYIEIRSFIDSALENAAQEGGIPINVSNALSDLSDIIGPESERFMLAENNPFVRAYETTMGRGLAGTMGNISFNWLDGDYTWETDYNARAPKGVNISFSFNVIHDIAPGLDHSGYNRAPLYNVGNIMKEIAGDAHGDVLSAEAKYKKNKVNFKTGE